MTEHLDLPMIRVYTLGRLLVKRETESLSGFVSQKTILLLVYLLHHPGEHQREVLAELFWTDTSSKQALKNLRTILSSLQKQLGDYLMVTRQTIGMLPEAPFWLDSTVFANKLNTVQERLQRPYSPRLSLAMLAETLDLYQGDFLIAAKDSSDSLYDWVYMQRDHLRERHTNALYNLIEIAREHGYLEQGIHYGRQLLTLDPYWESAQRIMMQLLAQSGARNAALKAYEHFAKLLSEELDVEPEDETQKLYRQIKTGRLHSPPQKAYQHNLEQLSDIYIEPPQLQTVQNLLSNPDIRLITLLGSGGTGKTRMAQHLAHQSLPDFTDGVYFVNLSSLTEAHFVTQAILNAINVPLPDVRRQQKSALISYLRERHLLLILDNFEHVGTAVDILQDLLAQAPYLQILVTSREQLHLQAEHIVNIDGFDLSSDGARHAAVQLFGHTARKLAPSFDVESHLNAIHEICRLVDGLPLGIVLAAGWVQFMSPEDIAARIQDRLDFLSLTRLDLPERHRSITALLNSTWSTLEDEQQNHMMRLSAFPGDFDLEAALHVSEGSIEDLQAIIAKSLLQSSSTGRFQMHDLLRRFIRARATEAERLQEGRNLHRDYYRQWVLNLWDAQLPSQDEWVAIDREFHNLWHFDWMPLNEQLEHILYLALVLPDYWIARGRYVKEGIRLIEQALEMAAPELISTRVYTNAMIRLGQLWCRMNEYEHAQIILLEALERAQAQQDLALEGLALNEIERVMGMLGDFEQSRDYLLKMIEIYEASDQQQEARIKQIFSKAYSNLAVVYLELQDLEAAEHYSEIGYQRNLDAGDEVGAALALNTHGIVDLDRGHLPEAQAHFSDALAIATRLEHTRHQTIFSGNLAEALHRQGKYQEAYAMYRDTLERAHQIDNHKTMINVLEQLCDIELDLGNAQRAAQALGAARSLRERAQIAIHPRQHPEIATREERLQAALSTEIIAQHLELGEQMQLEDVIRFVCARPDTLS